ncbi:MAG TPA: single-stranded DNA-binding protein [Candidatus Paceibacterota bacterium]
MDYNRVIIVGRLTRDPELKALPMGGSVTTFSVATGRVWKDRDGNKKEDTQFHNVVVFGKQAETVAQYLKKGQEVLVEGRLQTRSWDDKTSGEKKYRTEIVADRVQFGAKSGGAGGPSEHITAKGAKGPGESDAVEYPEENINPEDIPF